MRSIPDIFAGATAISHAPAFDELAKPMILLVPLCIYERVSAFVATGWREIEDRRGSVTTLVYHKNFGERIIGAVPAGRSDQQHRMCRIEPVALGRKSLGALA